MYKVQQIVDKNIKTFMNIDFSEQCYECLFREQNALSYASCSCVTADSFSQYFCQQSSYPYNFENVLPGVRTFIYMILIM